MLHLRTKIFETRTRAVSWSKTTTLLLRSTTNSRRKESTTSTTWQIANVRLPSSLSCSNRSYHHGSSLLGQCVADKHDHLSTDSNRSSLCSSSHSKIVCNDIHQQSQQQLQQQSYFSTSTTTASLSVKQKNRKLGENVKKQQSQYDKLFKKSQTFLNRYDKIKSVANRTKEIQQLVNQWSFIWGSSSDVVMSGTRNSKKSSRAEV